MYFILRGSVNVVKDGVTLATLEQGAHFGEMALAERKPTIRTASAICITPVSVGSLSITNFNIICESYPIFESKISEEVDKRKKDMIDKTKVLTTSKLISSTRKSHASINKKSKAKKNRESIKNSNKGSRQSAYEVEDNDEAIKPLFSQNLNFADNSQKAKSKKYSLKSENTSKHKSDKRRSVRFNPGDYEDKESENNDSHQLLVIRENPNDPDSVLIREQERYQADINDEESEDFSIKSRSRSSKKSKNSFESNKEKSSHISNELQMGEAIVKSANSKWRFLRKLRSTVTSRFLFRTIILLLVLYNLIFIPLQAAYKIEYNPGYIIMEVLTLIFYAIDIVT
jgi:hypothetical protein